MPSSLAGRLELVTLETGLAAHAGWAWRLQVRPDWSAYPPETCTGPHAYVGAVSSYYERITEDFDRIDDDRWASELQQGAPANVPWMQDLVVR